MDGSSKKDRCLELGSGLLPSDGVLGERHDRAKLFLKGDADEEKTFWNVALLRFRAGGAIVRYGMEMASG